MRWHWIPASAGSKRKLNRPNTSIMSYIRSPAFMSCRPEPFETQCQLPCFETQLGAATHLNVSVCTIRLSGVAIPVVARGSDSGHSSPGLINNALTGHGANTRSECAPVFLKFEITFKNCAMKHISKWPFKTSLWMSFTVSFLRDSKRDSAFL